MEVAKPVFKEKLKTIFLKDKVPFAYKSDVNWKTVRNCFFVSIGLGVLILLLMPAPKNESAFHEKLKSDAETTASQSSGQDPTQEAINQMNRGALTRPLSRFTNGSGGGTGSGDRNASMILTRGGLDSKTQLPAGSRIAVHLTEIATVATTGMPVIGIVTRDFVHEDAIAIPQGSKLFGQVSFNGDGDRAQIDWRSVQLPDGRERQLTAIGVGQDGQVGVYGTIHSNAVKNTVGLTLTHFIGAYAQGSMQTGILGAGPGGSDNGWKNAISQTANDEAGALAEKLKKEKRWIELSPQMEFYAVLTNNFVFRDPGATNGR
jgi:type IV secretory pathway VirB10-like protein